MSPPLLLVVEDVEDNMRLCTRLLRKGGYRWIEARDGREALEQARTHHPDLILLDLRLPEPGPDGWVVARTLRQDPAFQTTRIVALTAHAMAGDREKALEAGCDDVLTKPIEVSSFLVTIGRILEAHRA